ncbi:MAG: thioredoxin domain-containing protein [Sphingomonadales bacterium]|nr:thioredoxin domain-containing protein [Sphingomonadales bacterium]
MILKRLLATLSALALGLAPAQAQPPLHKPAAPNWNAVVTVTPAGTRVVGNPDAKVKLTEYVSYTCPHCAHFEEASAGQINLAFVAGGKGSVEVRHVVRDPVDMTIALLTNCVPANRFFILHAAFMRQQEKWVARLQGMSETQQKRWNQGDNPGRFRAIASDLQFYDFVAGFGLGRIAADRCFGDAKLAERIVKQTSDAGAIGVNSTPSFALDGVVLAGTHDWSTLAPQIAARM